MILRNFISLRAFTVYMKTHCGLKFHFGQFDRGEICTEVNFTAPEVMWTLTTKLPHTEVKFYPEVKSQTGLSSLRVSCKRALNWLFSWGLGKEFFQEIGKKSGTKKSTVQKKNSPFKNSSYIILKIKTYKKRRSVSNVK